MPGEKILSLDIGGSSIKATILNEEGKMLHDYAKVKTPDPSTPENVVMAIKILVKEFDHYDKVSVGFPGYLKKGVVYTAPNLGTNSWKTVNLNLLVRHALQKPVRTINDADMQGLAFVKGKGLEMMVTLGTGFGTALLLDGNLMRHIELAQHPITKNHTYDSYVGEAALVKEGKEKWNKRIKKIVKILKTVFNYDHLYIGGGNASKIDFKLDDNIEIVTNKDGIKGGARLWTLDEDLFMKYHHV